MKPHFKDHLLGYEKEVTVQKSSDYNGAWYYIFGNEAEVTKEGLIVHTVSGFLVLQFVEDVPEAAHVDHGVSPHTGTHTQVVQELFTRTVRLVLLLSPSVRL